MDNIEIITGNKEEFLNFLKTKFPLYHLSNLFFRDLYYGVISYLETKGEKVKRPDAEKMTGQAAAAFESVGLFKRIDEKSWLLNYPPFALPKVEKKVS